MICGSYGPIKAIVMSKRICLEMAFLGMSLHTLSIENMRGFLVRLLDL